MPTDKTQIWVSRGLLLFVLLLTWDGALRKWLIPGMEQLLFILKDGLLLLLFIIFYTRGHHLVKRFTEIPGTFNGLFFVYALWVLIEIFNPSTPTLAVGIWGAKSHLLYASLILLLPFVLHRPGQALEKIGRLYPWIVIPVCALAFLQIVAPPDSFINQNVRGGMESLAYFGEANLVRVVGPFSYVTGMSAFVIFAVLLGLGLYIAGMRSWLFLIGFGVAVMALPVTGARSVVVIAVVGGALMVFSAMIAGLVTGRFLVRAFITLGSILAVSLLTQDTAWEALGERFDGSREEGEGRVRDTLAFGGVVEAANVAGLVGFGAGTANNGAVALAPDVPAFSWLPPDALAEGEQSRIVAELGVIGWLASFGMRSVLLAWSARLAFRGCTRMVRANGVLAIPFMAIGLVMGNGVVGAAYAAVSYWVVVGLMGIAQHEESSVRRQLLNRRRQLLGACS